MQVSRRLQVLLRRVAYLVSSLTREQCSIINLCFIMLFLLLVKGQPTTQATSQSGGLFSKCNCCIE